MSLLALLGVLAACRPSTSIPRAPKALLADPEVQRLHDSRVNAVKADPNDADAWRLLGRAHEASGLLDLARQCYDRSLSLAPDLLPTLYRRALVSQGLDDLEQARADYAHIIELGEEAGEAHWRLGFLELDAGELETALASFDAALEGQPDVAMATARVGRARCLSQLGRHEEALGQVEGLLRLRPSDASLRQLRHALSRKLGQRGRPPLVAADRPRAQGGEWASRAQRDRVGLSVHRAEVDRALDGGDPGRALTLLQEHFTDTDDVDLLTTWGVAELRAGRFEASLEKLDRAVQLAPGRHRPRAHRAESLAVLGRVDEAMAEVEEARRLGPGSALTAEVHAKLLRQQRRLDEALVALRESLRIDPGRRSARSLHGSLLFEMRRHREAAAAFQQSLEHDPSDHLAWLGLAMSRVELGDLHGAGQALEQGEKVGLDLVPETDRVQRRLDELLAEAGSGSTP
ncbi:MAG: tetratricopeptide repeat protein [Acidobacteriota bacterium]